MKVRFLPQDIEIEIAPNQTVLDVAQKNNIFVKSVCNGVPSCAECRIRVTEGNHNVLPPSGKELTLIGTAHFIDQRRLACQVKVFGDITVDLSEQVQKEAMEGSKRRMKLGVTKDAEVSRARAGNLIDQDQALIKEVDKEVGHRVVTSEDRASQGASKTPEGKQDTRTRHRDRDRRPNRNRRNDKKSSSQNPNHQRSSSEAKSKEGGSEPQRNSNQKSRSQNNSNENPRKRSGNHPSKRRGSKSGSRQQGSSGRNTNPTSPRNTKPDGSN